MQTPQYIWQRQDWPHFHWRSDDLLGRLGECRLAQGQLLATVTALGFDPSPQAEILIEEARKTAAIEGERLDARTVRSSVARRLGLPSAILPVDRNVEGLVDVLLDATRNCHAPLTPERLRAWLAALFPTGYSGLHKISTEAWRGDTPMQVVSGPVGRETVHYEAPPVARLDAEIDTFLHWWTASLNREEGLIRAAVTHLWFVTIHPFEDGNGRIARALTDMAIAQDDGLPYRYYSLSSQIMAERDDYYAILEQTQKGGMDITPWLTWFLDCFGRSIHRSEKILAVILKKAAFWQRHARTPITERQRKVVNRLLDAGPQGFEGGLTTRKYAAMTKASKATASREIHELLTKDILRKNPGGGRSASYEINWPE